MTRYPFTYEHKIDGKTVLEIECLLSASAELDGVTGEPVVTVDGVYIDGPDGVLSLDDGEDQILRLLSDAIAKAAEADDAFCGDVIADEDIVYEGAGSNDPYGRFVRR